MYSIKTDLGVAGNGTIDKDLLVNGNAVVKGNLQVDGTVDFKNATFTQITVSGDANLADITSTGTSNLADVNVSGNTVLGDSATDSLTVQATSTFAAPVVLQQNISQTSGTASFKAASADSLAVAGETDLNGNLVMADGTTATLQDTTTEDLTVNGNAVVGGTLGVTGKATFQDVEINGTLSGNYTMDAGNFNSIKVANLSDLNNVSIKGATTLTGNVTGANSTVAVNRLNMQGADGIIEFAYNDPARPSDTKTSLEPYQVSSQAVLSKKVTSNAADIGVVGGTEGLHAIGNATIDYLKLTGNSTIGDQTQLQVAGRSVFTGSTTVGDLIITGTVSGLTFTDLNAATLNITGNSTLQGGVTVGGNLTGGTSSIAKFSTFTVANGTGTNHGIIQFDYNDSTRPSDIKSSIEPYKISTNDVNTRNIVSESANIGVVGGTSGLHAIGKATVDYLSIAGNSTIGTATPQLQVAGDSVLHDTTVNNLTINGTVTGLTFDDLSVNTLAVSGNSTLTGGVTVGGNLTGSNTAIAKFSTFTVAAGTAGNNGIIQFDYNDSARPSDIKSSVEPYKVSTNDVAANNVVTANATVGNVGGTAGLTALGTSTMDYIHVKGNSTIGTAQPQLQVDGKSILGDVDFTGVVTGLTVDVSGQDLTPNSVVAAAELKGQTLESVTTATVGTDLTVGGTADITGALTAAGAAFSGDVTVTDNSITVKDLIVTGTTTGVTVAANVDGLDIKPNSVEATAGITAASADVSGSVEAGSLSSGSLTVTGASTVAGLTAGATSATTLTVSGNTTLAGLSATTLAVPNVTGNTTFANDVTISGTLTPSTIDLSTTAVDAASVSTTGNVNVGGDLVVAGTIDLSAADVSVKSITATDASTLPTLNSTTATITTVDAGTVSATSVSATGNVSAATVTSPTVQGATGGTGTLNLASDTVAAKDFTVTGSFMPNGGIVTTGDISAANVTASSVVKAGSVESATIQAEPAGAGTVTIASDAVAAKDFTVTGTFKPEGGLDLSAVDITSKSITTTEGATIGGNLSVAGSVDLSGADVTALSFTASDADKTNTFPKLASTAATVGTLTATGASTLAGVSATNVTASGTLSVTGATTLAGLTAGAVSASGVTASGTVSAATFTSAADTVEIAKSTNVTGDFHATGTLTAGAIDLSTTDVSVKSLNSLGNAHVTGDLTVDGQFDLSATNLQAASLTSTNNTTVGADLEVTGDSSLSTLETSGLATLNSASVTTTLGVTGATTLAGVTATSATVSGATNLATVSTSGLATLNSASVTTTLNVTGATTVAGLTAGATSATTLSTSGLATLASLDVTGNTVAHGNLTVEGTLLPQGGLDLTGADIEANSLALAAGATVGTTLGVTGNTTVGGTLGVTGAATLAAGLTVSGGNVSVSSGTITSSGAGRFGSVTADNGLTVTAGNATVTAGNLVVTAGNIAQNGASTTTASFKKTSTTNLHVGTLVWDEDEYIGEFGGNVHISGDLDVDGTINAQINLTGRDIAPRSVNASQSITVGTTLGVTGQATMASAVIGTEETEANNNLQIYGNTTCTGDFAVQGKIIGTLDQSSSNVAALSFTATNAVKGATLESTGATTVGNALTVSAGGANITGNSSVTGNLSASGSVTGATVTSTGALTVSGGGASITGNSTVTGTLSASGALSGGSISTTGTLAAGTSTLGATTVSSLTVSGTSSFTGLATVANLTSTGLITANNLTVTGTLTADISSLTTTAISTKKYDVQAEASVSVAGGSGSTWTPDGLSNVYNITLTGTGGVTIGKMPITTGKAASWFIYITQDSASTSNTVSWGSDQKVVGDGAVNTAANSVSICQLVYCGYGSIIDVFIAQRSL